MLRKFVLPAVLLLGVHAGAEEWDATGLIGVEVGSMSFDAKDDLGQSYNKSAADVGLRLGAKSEEYRILGQYHITGDYKQNGNTVKNTLATLHLDFMFWNWDLGENTTLKPYIGANGGYHEYKYGSYINENGTAVGAETGLLLDLPIFDVDLGIRYMGSENDAVNSIFNVYLGIDLKLQP